MSYIKINGEDTHYNVSLEPFTTQHGYEAVRFVGDEIPETDKGFKMYDDDDKEIADLTRYQYIYKPNEYATEHDEIVSPAPYNEPLPPNPIDVRLSNMSRQIGSITPYTESKTAYIDDEYVLFNIPKDGNISVFMVDGEGQNVPHTFEQINGQIKVSFKKRVSLATVTISIQ